MEITKTSERCNYSANTETALAKYNLRYVVEDGTLRRVSASVEMKESSVRGNLSYDRGEYNVEMFPYGDGSNIDSAISDFKTVVETIKSGLTTE